MAIEAILFDMDGVLVLSEPLHLKAWQHTTAHVGLSEQALAEQDIIGLTDTEIALNLIEQYALSMQCDRLIQQKQQAFYQIAQQGIPKVKGIDQFISSRLGKLKMAVVSSSSRDEIRLILESADLAKNFSFYIGFEDTNNHKPDPEPYTKAMKKLSVNPGDVLIVEDSPAGIQAAIDAGARVAGMDTSGLLTNHDSIPKFQSFDDLNRWLLYEKRIDQ